MPMNFIDARPAAYTGNLPYATLVAIMNNSIYNPNLPFGAYNLNNTNVTVVRGAHNGAFYPGYGRYYFDIQVGGGPVAHCLIGNPSNANSNVLAIR